jgi:hypothetical protein
MGTYSLSCVEPNLQEMAVNDHRGALAQVARHSCATQLAQIQAPAERIHPRDRRFEMLSTLGG